MFQFYLFELVFLYLFKPISLLFIAINYYFAYGILLLAKFMYKIAANLEQSKEQRENLLSKMAKLPFPHQEVYKDSIDMIVASGYHFEIHNIITEDQYIIKAWRLNKGPSNLKHKYPIILQHGLLDCSWSWFMNNSQSKSLPYILCGLGYDVWVTNNRGNIYSIGHSLYQDPENNRNYWDYSLDELIQYDVKANVQHILQVTGKNKVIYIGHSQGTSQMFGQLCENPEFEKNIKCFIGYGPALYATNMRSNFVKKIIKYRFLDLLYWIGHPSFFVFDKTTNRQIGALCYMMPFIYQNMLFAIVNLLCGYPEINKIDLRRFGVMVSHEPGGASTKNLVQWFQFARRREFAKFDYGCQQNMQVYGQEFPPLYKVDNLKDLKIPLYMFIGEKDMICDDTDIAKLFSKLNLDQLNVQYVKDYAHLDYIWGVDANEKLYSKTLPIICKMQNE